MLDSSIRKSSLCAFVLFAASSACSGSDGHKSDQDGGDEGSLVDSGAEEIPIQEGWADGGVGTCERVVSDSDCDKSLRPIVFVHGTFGSGDQLANPAMLFGSNGYCQDRIVAIEYDSVQLGSALGGDDSAVLDKIDALVDEIRQKTGQDQVELIGHSQGTSHSINYLSDPTRAAKVAHYINVSGETKIPDGVHALSLSSENDLGGAPHHAPGADSTVTLKKEDHVQLASSTAGFVEMYKYLLKKKPKYTEIQCGDAKVTLEGIAETFGDNEPIVGGSLEVYELGDSPRTRGKPLMTLSADSTGHVKPFKLKRLTAYEFKALGADGKLVGHAYFPPFIRSNRLLRFLAPSQNLVVSALSTDRLERGAGFSAVVARTYQGTFRHDLGRSLTMNGTEVLTDGTAGDDTATVGLFMSDQNLNKKTDLGVAFQVTFMAGTDVYMDAEKAAWLAFDSNGYTMKIPNWPSDEGLISVMFP
jgi:pimeloyl-ACP methyl ester carboxylesterase